MSYYLSGFLDTAGIKGDTKQTNVQLGMSAIQIVSAAIGAGLVDHLGRRPLLLAANLACGLCWIGVIAPASIANITDTADEAQTSAVDPSVSRAVLAMVYMFQICYSVGWTPMQALVPVEVLSYEMRAKGMAFSSLFTSVALLATQFGVPVALEKIQWKTYIVFCVWCFVQAAVLFVLLPETKNRTVSTFARDCCEGPANKPFYSLRSLTRSSNPVTRSRPLFRRRSLTSMSTLTSSTSTVWMVMLMMVSRFMPKQPKACCDALVQAHARR